MPTREEMIRQFKLDDMRSAMKADSLRESRMSSPDVVNDEMPSWVADTDRLKAKNLTNNEDEQVAFLQRQYPDAEVKSDGSRVLLRKKGESAYGVLDPSFSLGKMFSKEGLRDTGDIIGDIGQGVAEGLGAAAGAGAGLPGIMAGSAVAAGAASSAKEKLAEMLGVKQADYGNATVDAAIGGVLPGGFAVAGKGLKLGAKKVLPWAYSKATGLSTDALKTISNMTGDIAPGDPLKFIKEARGAVSDNVDSAKGRFREAYTALRGSGASVDTNPVIGKLDELIEAARAKRMRSNLASLSEEEKALTAMKERLFASASQRQSQGIKVAGSKSSSRGTGKWHTDPATGRTTEVMSETPGVAEYMDDGINSTNIVGGNQDVSDAMDLRSLIKDNYIEYSDNIGGKIGQGGTPVSIQEERAAHDLVKIMDDQIFGVDGAGRELNSNYGDLVDKARYLNRKFGTDEKAQHTLRNMRKGKDQVLRGEMAGLDEATQRKLSDVNKRLEIDEYFHEPNANLGGNYIKKGADNILGKSPLSKALAGGGAFAGYMTGGGYAGSAIGAAAGRGLGEILTSPSAVRKITRNAKKLGIKMDNLEQLLTERPELLPLLYGSTTAATQD